LESNRTTSDDIPAIGIQSVNAIEFDQSDVLDPNIGAFDVEQCLDSQSDDNSSDEDSEEDSENESGDDPDAVAAVVGKIADERLNLNVGGMLGMIHSVFVCRNDSLRVGMFE
jgi:hypothetical protein